MAESPYSGTSTDQWEGITEGLIERYPLSLTEIREIAEIAWTRLWSSNIGGQISLDEVDLPATVVGYFFQKLFAHELSTRHPAAWRGEREKADKDLVNLQDGFFSTEMKASGQMKYEIFGNRSYNQETQNAAITSKNKSGFYITLNFVNKTITLLRLGWIDQEDWSGQESETGQAAQLSEDTYKYKLVQIPGDYRRNAPVGLLRNVGDKTADKLRGLGIETILDVIQYQGTDKSVLKVKKDNKEFLEDLQSGQED